VILDGRGAIVVNVARVVARLFADDNGLGPTDQDPATVHATACKVLDAPCSTVAPPKPPTISNPPNAGGLLSILFYALVVGAVAGLLYLLVLAVRRRGRQVAVAENDEDDDRLPRTIIDRETEPDQWRRQAAEMLAAGRYREALRCRYRALVGDLARRGVLDEIPGRTTGEERAQFSAAASPAEPAFARATELFDDVWYGDEPAGIAELDLFGHHERDVLAQTGHRNRR
jgi:Domain of unknown function (DUF4129)